MFRNQSIAPQMWMVIIPGSHTLAAGDYLITKSIQNAR